MSEQITCDNCGACCREMNNPPGYWPGVTDQTWPDWTGDRERFAALPDAAIQAIQDRIQAIQDRIDSGEYGDLLCCWLDAETLRCRWYEHRPSICREFEVGNRHCLEWREKFGITKG